MLDAKLMDVVVNSLAIGVGLIGLIGIQLHKADEASATHRGPLSLLIFLLTFSCFLFLLQMVGVVAKTNLMLVASLMVLAPIPTITWLYVVRLTSRTHDTLRIGRRHWIAAILCAILLLPILAVPELAQDAELTDELAASTRVLFALLGYALFLMLWIAHLGLVGWLTVRRVRSHRKRLQDVLSETQGLDLRWIDGLLIFIAGSIVLLVADLVSAMLLPEPILGPVAEDIFTLGVIAGLVIFGLKQSSPGPDFEAPLPSQANANAPQNEPASYDRSSLSEQDCKMLAFQLEALMSREKPWLDPFLDLKTLSQLVGSKPYYVTQALNTVLEKNFYGYVNSWRVDEAARLLLESDDNVLAISELSGFNSKSTFNATFRKEKGLTPSAYRRENRALAAA